MTSRINILRMAIAIICLVVLYFLLFFLEYAFIMMGYPPIVLWVALTIGIMVGTLIMYPGSKQRRRSHVVVLGIFVAAVIALPYVDLTSMETFYRFYSDVQPGMSSTEVEQLFDRRFPATGRFPKPLNHGVEATSATETTQSFQLEQNDATFITIDFQNGRVSQVNYSPD
jgi:hypothetical protein